MFPPSRIVCLTEETVETLYLLGEQDRIVGISGYVVRPPQARREKPRVSAFSPAVSLAAAVIVIPVVKRASIGGGIPRAVEEGVTSELVSEVQN